jgi:hypothetical protein
METSPATKENLSRERSLFPKNSEVAEGTAPNPGISKLTSSRLDSYTDPYEPLSSFRGTIFEFSRNYDPILIVG